MPRKRVKARTRHAKAKASGIAALGGYDYVLAQQGGGCAICGRPPKPGGRRLNVDHAHTGTLEVRGLLCMHHNRGLASFQDCPAFLEAAAIYLKYGNLAACAYRDAALNPGRITLYSPPSIEVKI